MLKLIKYANAIYNLYRYDISCSIKNEEFLTTKFFVDQYKMEQLCNLLYRRKAQ